MSLKLKTKTAFFKLLDYLPERIGYSLYHFAQEKLGKQHLLQKVAAAENSFENLKSILAEAGVDIKGKSILEIGSGWLPIMPYYLVFFGKAAKIHSYDLRKHYRKNALKKLNVYFSEKYGLNIKAAQKEYPLPGEITYYPNHDLSQTVIPKVDVVFSRFVLEHVNPADMESMHKKFKKKMSPGSYIVHLISPSDHRAYLDKSLSLQDFLKYSEKEWTQMQTKFDYHNRWRLPQYIELFKSLNYEVVYLKYDKPGENSPEYEKLKTLSIHPDFEKFSDEELMAGSINIVLKV